MSKDIQPIFILPESTQRTTGKNAQRNNILAAKLIGETVRTTLGPKGMDKMLVDNMGEVTITNDGVTILKEMQVEHPAAKMIVEIAKTQESEVGDGTTTAVVIAGELLKNAESLLDQNVHPTVIAKGYLLANEKAQQLLQRLAEPLSLQNKDILEMIAMTAMTGKGAESAKEHLAQLTVQAVQLILEKGTLKELERSDISIEKKDGAAAEKTELIKGIILDKERVHTAMPKTVSDAKIAIVDSPIEIKNTEIDAKIQITEPEKMQAFLNMEEHMIKAMVEKIRRSGATVLFCQKGIDDLAQYFLAKQGIYACRRVKRTDVERLARATGARIVTNLDDLKETDLGSAGIVEEVKVGEDFMTYIKECKLTKTVTLLVRGSTEHITAELKRAMEDAVGDVIAAVKDAKVVAGAGSVEIELARQLRQYADSLSGREQLAVKAFAESIEVIPKTLAENAGLDPIDVLAELKASHDKGMKWAGINVFTGKVMDAWKEKVIEPLKIKTHAISSASEVAMMILRIDDVIAAGQSKPVPMQQQDMVE
ncbi:MAG: thermosome subunit beta [archaeon]